MQPDSKGLISAWGIWGCPGAVAAVARLLISPRRDKWARAVASPAYVASRQAQAVTQRWWDQREAWRFEGAGEHNSAG